MSCAKNARKLADYLNTLPELNQIPAPANKFSYYHIGALFTDVVLQAGLNYNSVVKPRVQKVLLQYPEHYTISKFQTLIDQDGLHNIISWTHSVKLERFGRLMEFSVTNNIDTCADLKYFFSTKYSSDQFLALNGFGPKSLDYLLKLLNIDTVAVDRHIYSFVKMADIEIKGYQETKKVVEFAADFLDIPRSSVDQIIWNYMSGKKYQTPEDQNQFVIEFPELK